MTTDTTSGSILGWAPDWWKAHPHLSPVLEHFSQGPSSGDPSKMPSPMPVCGCCPAATWYVMEGEPMVFCGALRMYPWKPGRAISDCDARRRAIAMKEAG